VLARKSPSLRPANRSTWKRSDADSKQRRWQLNDDAQLVTHHEERLRIVPQALWDAVNARQQSVEGMTVKLRGAVRHKGVLPRHVLSGLLVCQVCGGTIRRVNGREYGCATHKDGGDAACSNGIRGREEIAERKLLDELACEMLSPEGVALVKQRVNEHVRKASRAPKSAPKPQAALIERKRAEIAQLRTLMTAGTLSQAVAQAAVEKAQEEIQSLERMQPAREEKHTARVIRMLPPGGGHPAQPHPRREPGPARSALDHPRAQRAVRDVRREGAAPSGRGEVRDEALPGGAHRVESERVTSSRRERGRLSVKSQI
jgi:hypothetical protein